MKEKGQIFTWDLVFSTLIFLIILFIMIFIWDNALLDINVQEVDHEMNWLSKTVTQMLVTTPGVPFGWNVENVEVYGLAKTVKNGDTLSAQTQVIDPNKLMSFIIDGVENYTKTRRKLLSSSRYNYYIEFSCLNGSSVDCFQGLKLDSVNFDVKCSNPYTFTVTNFVTDSYKWVEAEALWGNSPTGSCIPAFGDCSNGESSLVHDSGDVEIGTNPGRYNIWVRCLQDINGMRLRVNGAESPKGCDIVGAVFNWSNFGTFNLTKNTRIGFNYTGTGDGMEVDALLLTTRLNYDPGIEGMKYFGNPNNVKNCLIGNFSSEAAKAVSNTKTASFSESMTEVQFLSGQQPYLSRSIKLKTVVWTGGS